MLYLFCHGSVERVRESISTDLSTYLVLLVCTIVSGCRYLLHIAQQKLFVIIIKEGPEYTVYT